MRPEICTKEFVQNLKADSNIGYAYEVSIHIPKELHAMPSDLPPLPEKITIDESMLSDFQRTHFPATDKGPAER